MEKLQPKLRFPEFKGDWVRKLFKNTCAVNPTNKKLPNKFIYIDLESVKDGFLYKENEILLDEAPSRAQRLLAKEDVLFQMVRPYQMNNFYFDKEGDYVASTGYAQLRSNDSSQFIFQYLHNQIFVDKVIEKCTGSNYPAINSTDLANIFVVFPENNEQTKIATFLSSIDEKLNLLKEKKTLLEDYKKGIMQKIFNQEIRFKDDNGNDFENWEEKSFNSVLKSFPTKKHQIQSSDIFENGEYPVIDQGKKLIAGFSDKLNKLFKDNPIIIFGDHTTILKYIDFDFIVGADGTKLLKNINTDNLKYLYYNLMYNNVEQEGYKRHFSILQEISLQIPSIVEQTKIANFLSAIDEKIELISNQIQDTQEYKKGLLQQMFV